MLNNKHTSDSVGQDETKLHTTYRGSCIKLNMFHSLNIHVQPEIYCSLHLQLNISFTKKNVKMSSVITRYFMIYSNNY